MGQATAELYPAKMSKGQRLVSGFRQLNRFLRDFAGARQFAQCEATSTSYSAKVLPWLSKLSRSATPQRLDCFDEPLTRCTQLFLTRSGVPVASGFGSGSRVSGWEGRIRNRVGAP